MDAISINKFIATRATPFHPNRDRERGPAAAPPPDTRAATPLLVDSEPPAPTPCMLLFLRATALQARSVKCTLIEIKSNGNKTAARRAALTPEFVPEVPLDGRVGAGTRRGRSAFIPFNGLSRSE